MSSNKFPVDDGIISTIVEMMSDRNYRMSKINHTEDEDDFLCFNIIFESEEALDNYKIFFTLSNDLNIKLLEIYLQILSDENVKNCVIVYRDVITSKVKNSINLFSRPIELFNENELKFNITKHRLVPKHILLSDQEKNMLKEINKFPLILKIDPISKYYNFKRGQVIKIIRKDKYVTYRLVV